MDMVDTTTDMGKSMLSIYQKFGSVRFSAYIQPQFQWTESKGGKNFSGGDFAPNSNNRFMFRRSRIRMDYAHYNKQHELSTYFAFQIDATERGVVMRDVWGRLFDNKFKLFSLTTGMFARPFGYEVNLSSATRESPERGRMSQTIMKTERDLGAMVTFEPRKEGAKLDFLKIHLGVFNGQGMAGPVEFDSYKDVIGRVSLKPKTIKSLGMVVSAGTSVLYGAVGSQSPWRYQYKDIAGQGMLLGDSTPSNLNYAFPRRYYGADVQVRFPNKNKWTSEFRAEYITGTQSGTAGNSETPGSYPVANGIDQPLYIRRFDGAYFYYLQNIVNKKHQVVFKYDWYDPNKLMNGTGVSKAVGASAADVRYDTFGFGYVYYANDHLKLTLWYDNITNETTAISGFTGDVADDVFTCRLQYTF